MMRPATPEEVRRWDELIGSAPGGQSFWQELTYAKVKTAWRPVLAVHELESGPLAVLYLQKNIPGFGRYWYAASGPRVATAEELAQVCADLREQSPAFAITMEPPLPADGPEAKETLAAGIEGLEPSADIQPGSHTVVVDLRPSEEEMLASFKQRVRRALRKVEKAGAVVEGPRTDDEAMDVMWDLYQVTADRSGMLIRGRDYHDALWRAYIRAGQGAFFVARTEEGGDPAAAAFVLRRGPLALYKDGGSLRTRDASGLQYLLQWEIMRWAKAQGCTGYDMLGAPPSWQADDETHGLHSLVQFKTGFAPITDEIGAVTLVRRPAVWRLWDRGGRRVVTRALASRNRNFY